MTQRPFLGKPAEITFTADFHEIVVGDLRPGNPLLLRYDPHRIVPPEEPHRFGDPERPVTAHMAFHAGSPPLELVLRSPGGIIPCPDVDPTGQGSMLAASLRVPADADLLMVWFSYTNSASTRLYDSEGGANYWFGFPGRDLITVTADVVRRPDAASDRFEVSVDAVPSVEAVSVRYVLAADRDCIKHELRLNQTSQSSEDAAREGGRWAGAADVPHGAIARFRVCYWIGGHRLIDDNGGAWYLAPAPEADRAPPPPPDLLDAAAAWS